MNHPGTVYHWSFSIRKIILLVLLGGLIFTGAAQTSVNSLFYDEINLIVGELETIEVEALTRLSLTDPSIADIVDAKVDEVLIIARNEGQTALFIWDEHGKRTLMIHVASQNLDIIKQRISELLKAAKIHEISLSVNLKEGKVIVTGEIPEEKKDSFQQIVDRFDENVIQLTQDETIEDLVQIDLQVTELNETLTKSIGINWFALGSTGSTIDNVGGGGFLNPLFTETLPDSDGKIEDFFKIGQFNRTSNLLFQVNALLQEGKGRILSRPKLVVKSGEEASFLVGGEIPIRTTTTSEGTSTENVSYKAYGINTTITPTIKKGNRIDIVLNTEISDIDASNKVGDNVAFTTRTARTQLVLDDGQTIVLAGLIRRTKSETINKVPFLGEIPILGILFRSRHTPVPDQDQELVISLTPNIISVGGNKKQFLDKKIHMPAETTSSPDLIPQRRFSRNSAQNHSAIYGIPREMREYVQAVQNKISRSIRYPQEAEEYGWEGTVKLGMLILSDGTLAYAGIKETSGHELFDSYTLKTAKNSAPYSGFPANTDLQELNLTIPVIYSLRSN